MIMRTKYFLMVLGIAAFLVGCSSSDDGRSADLQRQLDMRADISPEDLADLRAQVETLTGRADISPEDLAGLRAQIETAEQSLIDVRVALAAADKVRDAAAYGAEKLNRVGDVTIISN